MKGRIFWVVAGLTVALASAAQAASGAACLIDGEATLVSGPGLKTGAPASAGTYTFTGTLKNCASGNLTPGAPTQDQLGCTGETVTATVTLFGNCAASTHSGPYSVNKGQGTCGFSGNLSGVCAGANCSGTETSTPPRGGYSILFSDQSDVTAFQAGCISPGSGLAGPLKFTGAIGLGSAQ